MQEWKNEIRARLARLKLEPAREAAIVEELAQHLDDCYEELLASGVMPAEAERRTLAELSGSEVLQRKLRRVERPVNNEPVVLGAGRNNMIADLWQDLRYAVRSLRKHALLSSVVVATLTIGIGISAGVFAFFNVELLRARVDKDFDSFVRVYAAYTTDAKRPGRPGETTLEDYLAWRDRAKSLRHLAAYADFYAPFGQDDPVEARTLLVTANFFALYDLERPLLGRLLQPEDFSAASPVVVLSERLWRNRFAADPQIVGRVVHVNGQPVTVVGVTPNFAGMVNNARAWFPYTLETYLKHGDNVLRPGEAVWLNVAGRLNPGFSHHDAAAELKLLASQQDRLHPGRTTMLTVTDGSQIQSPNMRDRIWLTLAVILGALMSFVLVVCLNVTTLLLSRAAARRQEIAVRLALGAGRLRLVRMLLTETFLLAALAGLFSLYLAYHIPGLVDHWLINKNETAGTEYSLAPDWRVFGYLMLVTVLAGALAGLTPALQSLRVNLSEMLKGRQSSPSGGRGSRLYGLLIGAQVALSFLLLYGAGLFVRTFQQAAAVEPGFETGQVFYIDLFAQSGSAPRQRTWGAFHRTLTERLAAVPGVQAVAYSHWVPQSGRELTDVQAPGQALRQAGVNWVSPNFFSTLGIPIVSGRALREDDPPCEKSVCQVVVSQRLAREFWPNENPLGKTLRLSQGAFSLEVVGVAHDISMETLGGLDDPMIYLPCDREARLFDPLVRFSGDGATLARVVRATVRELAPELSLWSAPRTLQAVREEALESLGRITQLIVLLCVLAIFLAIIGIYGVVATAVSQRTKEMGIRLALGAQKKDIYRAVLGSSGRPIAIGLFIGLAVTVATFSAVATLLRDTEFTFNVRDPLNYAVTVVLLAGVALAALLIPARRATSVDPLEALRCE